jgi:DNA polymerase delta subunit 2
MDFKRSSPNVVVSSQRFLLPASAGGVTQLQQYSHLYTRRLAVMRESLRQLTKKWPTVRTVDKIIDCEYREEGDVAVVDVTVGHAECIIIGTLYKEMKLRPSVLDEFRDQNGMLSGTVQPISRYTSESDEFVLEDESGRIPLGGPGLEAVRASLVTGVVPALRGKVDSGGVFQVSDALFSGASYSRPTIIGDDVYVLLVSGLRIGAAAADSLSLQILADFVGGRLGGPEDIALASKIVRVVIAGDSLASAEISKRKYGVAERSQVDSMSAFKQLDVFLSDLASSVPVDLMPGATDPATLALPQQVCTPMVSVIYHANDSFSHFIPAYCLTCTDSPLSWARLTRTRYH